MHDVVRLLGGEQGGAPGGGSLPPSLPPACCLQSGVLAQVMELMRRDALELQNLNKLTMEKAAELG